LAYNALVPRDRRAVFVNRAAERLAYEKRGQLSLRLKLRFGTERIFVASTPMDYPLLTELQHVHLSALDGRSDFGCRSLEPVFQAISPHWSLVPSVYERFMKPLGCITRYSRIGAATRAGRYIFGESLPQLIRGLPVTNGGLR
jgi:hypothetical protein